MSEQIELQPFLFEHKGHCPACDQDVVFRATGPYFRSTLVCSNCKSEPRNRALMHCLEAYFPRWRSRAIHESSPGWDVVSRRLSRECENYIGSQYDTSVPFGNMAFNANMQVKNYRSENLENQTFEDHSFDLVITQDVFEHIFRPDLAISEIARTLKPGGATLMTVPITQKTRPSVRRASLNGTEVIHHLDAQHHGNPLGGGSLVTVDWGYDIIGYLSHYSKLMFQMVTIDNIDLGIRADLIEVLIGFKMPLPSI